MADLDLAPRPSGRQDFIVSGGDLVRTTQPFTAILRLLLQGTWIGDDGERTGDCLNDIHLITTQTRERVQRIVDTRLQPLIKAGEITSATLQDVTTIDGRLFALISVVVPGQQPAVVQVPLTR